MLRFLENEDDICSVRRWKGGDQPVAGGVWPGQRVVDCLFEVGDFGAGSGFYFYRHDVGEMLVSWVELDK